MLQYCAASVSAEGGNRRREASELSAQTQYGYGARSER